MKKNVVNKIISFSPYIELAIRWIYWKILCQFLYITPNVRNKRKDRKKKNVSFDEISSFIKNNGVKSSDILLVHSSFKELKGLGKSPVQLIENLKQIVSDGTLVMPSIRKFENDPPINKYLHYDYSEEVTIFDLYKTPVITGILPSVMITMPDSEISLHPLNNLVAIGRQSEEMMKNNIILDKPAPCGVNSSWKFCLDHDAYIVGLGVELASCLTMIHTIEDCMDENWPIKNWYRERMFKITKHNHTENKIIRERRPIWGSLHWAGRTLSKDLIKNNIVNSININGVIIEVISSKKLEKFLKSKNIDGYPYFCVSKKLK
jgi:aminoglycoside 3-N-acetyltransferase